MVDLTAINPALIRVASQVTFLPRFSHPESNEYTFAYTITISNAGDVAVQLISRHWIITDGNEEVQDVRGEGVVGEQPIIRPGRFFRYSSGATLATPVGYMRGEYTMIPYSEDTGSENREPSSFDVEIPAFTLHTPTSLN
ncbi:MAG: Co2+/Mg2+ efflux protein ApaG [Pseudomonadota bacterium]